MKTAAIIAIVISVIIVIVIIVVAIIYLKGSSASADAGMETFTYPREDWRAINAQLERRGWCGVTMEDALWRGAFPKGTYPYIVRGNGSPPIHATSGPYDQTEFGNFNR
jgi:hypothetical protein